MVDYNRLAKTAQRLIEKNGREITLSKRSRTAATAGKPWRGPDMTADETAIVKAVFVPATGGDISATSEDDTGSDTLRNVDQFLVAALSTNVDVASFTNIIDDGTWEIMKVQPLKPGPTNLLYAIEVRQ